MFDIKFSIDDQLFWETIKIMLRGKTISYSTFKKKERENIEFELESKLTILYQNGGTHEEKISKLESELENIRFHIEFDRIIFVVLKYPSDV
jgi:hypothetical protein